MNLITKYATQLLPHECSDITRKVGNNQDYPPHHLKNPLPQEQTIKVGAALF